MSAVSENGEVAEEKATNGQVPFESSKPESSPRLGISLETRSDSSVIAAISSPQVVASA